MTVTITIHTTPEATYEDLSCALNRIAGRLDADEEHRLDEGRLVVNMSGLHGMAGGAAILTVVVTEQRSIRLLRQVHSELPFPPYLQAEARVYGPDEIDINPHGALAVKTPDGLLGVEPGEFEWVENA